MQLRCACLPENFNRQRLATPRLAEALRGIFFRLSCAQNRPALSAATDAVRDEFLLRRYEQAFIELGHRRNRFGWNGWLRADKKAGGAGEGGVDRFAVRSSRLGHAVSR